MLINSKIFHIDNLLDNLLKPTAFHIFQNTLRNVGNKSTISRVKVSD